MNTIENRPDKIPKMDDIEWGGKLKQFAAYMWAIFYPKLYYEGLMCGDYSMSANDFYLIGRKNRHHSPVDISFKSHPEHISFEECQGKEKELLANWLSGYKRMMTSRKEGMRG
jgi:hypothetical protein